MIAEVSQSKLKYATDNDVTEYANRVMEFINKSYDPKDTTALKDFETTYNFLKTSDLTGEEFMIALNLASSQDLTDKNGDVIKFFRDINASNFNLYASAYKEFKKGFKPYELGKKLISDFLTPPPPEKTAEEKKAERISFYKSEFIRLQKGLNILGTTIFYELLKKKGLTQISLKYVERILALYVPESSDFTLSVGNKDSEIPKGNKIKYDVTIHFQNHFVHSVIKKENLMDLSETSWIEYWENLHNLKNE